LLKRRAFINTKVVSLEHVTRRRSRLHELTPCRSIQSAPPCRRQANIERAQLNLNRSQPGLPRSTGSASPVFGRTPNAVKSSRMTLTGVGTTKVAKERQAPRQIVSDRRSSCRRRQS